MKRHLNTLYVTTAGAHLYKDGENAVIKVEGREQGRIPVHLLGAVVCFGSIGVSPALMGHCAAKGVRIAFLGRSGKFLARVDGPVSGNVLLRRAQYRAADCDDASEEIVRGMVVGKLLNQRCVIRRAIRDHGSGHSEEVRERFERCSRRLKNGSRRCLHTRTVDSLRGIEGEGARAYWDVFDDLIRGDKLTFKFARRTKRPPLDSVNALLSFLYAMLTNDYRSAVETVGLDPGVGFLHRERPGRPSLALDMMEELRPVLADRLALSLINRRQLSRKDFESSVTGAVSLADEGRKKVLIAYQERKQSELKHHFLGEC